MGDDTVTLKRAWELFDSMNSDPKINFTSEPAGFEVQWRAFTQANTFSQNVWSDAYLAAFAKCGNYELVTLDQGFRQYPGLSVTILS
jgi:predicted nucleic acid-binding protein